MGWAGTSYTADLVAAFPTPLRLKAWKEEASGTNGRGVDGVDGDMLAVHNGGQKL